MKIAEFLTSEYPYPLPAGVVYAPIDIVGPLADGFVRAGHDVTWYAPKDTKTKAKVRSFGMKSLYSSKGWQDEDPEHRTRFSVFHDAVLLSHLVEEQENYDIIHLHSTRISLPFIRLIKKPVFITLHNPTNTRNAKTYIGYHKDLANVNYIPISNKQKKYMPNLKFTSTIYHGINIDNHPWSAEGGDRWVYIGRIIPEKGLDIAVRLAKKLNQGLDIFGPAYPDDPANWKYFKEKVEPYIDGELIKHHGSIERQKLFSRLAKSKGFLFPLHWEEPFGLTIIEAMASGTPTIAFKHGSLPEIIDDGKTGFLVNNDRQMLEAMGKIETINRTYCRKVAEENFSTQAMVDNYLSVFEKIASLK